jgi:hypothetical protein
MFQIHPMNLPLFLIIFRVTHPFKIEVDCNDTLSASELPTIDDTSDYYAK